MLIFWDVYDNSQDDWQYARGTAKPGFGFPDAEYWGMKIRLKLIQTLNKAHYHLINLTESAVSQDFGLLMDGVKWEPIGKVAQF